MDTDRITDFDQVPLYLDAAELAKTLWVPKSVAYRLLRMEGFPVTIIAGKKMVQKERLFDWIIRQEKLS